jgi:hypothetical protein
MPSEMVGWECLVCTYFNNGKPGVCIMCQMARPARHASVGLGTAFGVKEGMRQRKIEKLFDVGILHRALARAGQPFTVLCFCFLDICGNSAACLR